MAARSFILIDLHITGLRDTAKCLGAQAGLELVLRKAFTVSVGQGQKVDPEPHILKGGHAHVSPVNARRELVASHRCPLSAS